MIPTRERWEILDRMLESLMAQTVVGFPTVVVIDGEDEDRGLPQRPGLTVLTVPRGGLGLARNRGVAAAARPLTLLLADDIVPEPRLVETHLGAHARRPALEDAVLGLVRWHPEVAAGRIQHWMDWSGTQFDYEALTPGRAGWARLYFSNVSFKTALFDQVGGFDPGFRFLYEDIDLGWRMEQAGMRLWYEPDAVGLHLHRYDWPALRRRFEAAARAERLMTTKHPWFEPWFRRRCVEALGTPPPRMIWPVVVNRLPPGPLRLHGRGEANRWYYRHLAPFFLNAWEAERDLEELRAYLGDRFDQERLHLHSFHVESELAAARDEATFYRTSQSYLYDLTAFASWGTKIPYRVDIGRFAATGSRLLDYGSGIGADGLRLIEDGYRVDFADFDNPCTRYLRWRLDRRGITGSRVYDVEDPDSIPEGYDLAYSFDVIEHVDDPFDFLERLESRARLVAVNFLAPDPGDPHLHHELPISRLLDRAEKRGLLRYRLYHGRSHFVIYKGAGGDLGGRWRSRLKRHTGPFLSRKFPGQPPSSAGGACWSGT